MIATTTLTKSNVHSPIQCRVNAHDCAFPPRRVPDSVVFLEVQPVPPPRSVPIVRRIHRSGLCLRRFHILFGDSFIGFALRRLVPQRSTRSGVVKIVHLTHSKLIVRGKDGKPPRGRQYRFLFVGGALREVDLFDAAPMKTIELCVEVRHKLVDLRNTENHRRERTVRKQLRRFPRRQLALYDVRT